jgi:hypothetical protein
VPQSIRLERRRVNFTLSGPDMEPRGRLWDQATLAERHRWWAILAEETKAVKDRSLSKGLDRAGKRIIRAKPESREPYRRAGLGYTGPGLMPQRELSRTRRYLRVIAYPQGAPDRVVGYWLNKWGPILGYHARGEVKGAPIRDVVGLSDKDIETAIARARRRWAGEVAPATLPMPIAPIPQTAAPAARQGFFRRLVTAVTNVVGRLFGRRAPEGVDDLSDLPPQVREMIRRFPATRQYLIDPYRRRRRSG